MIEILNEDYGFNIFLGEKYAVNLDNPSIVKTLKIIELELMKSGGACMVSQRMIDRILNLSDSPFDHLSNAELVDIIRAGISVGYKFKTSGDNIIGYLIELEVDYKNKFISTIQYRYCTLIQFPFFLILFYDILIIF